MLSKFRRETDDSESESDNCSCSHGKKAIKIIQKLAAADGSQKEKSAVKKGRSTQPKQKSGSSTPTARRISKAEIKRNAHKFLKDMDNCGDRFATYLNIVQATAIATGDMEALTLTKEIKRVRRRERLEAEAAYDSDSESEEPVDPECTAEKINCRTVATQTSDIDDDEELLDDGLEGGRRVICGQIDDC